MRWILGTLCLPLLASCDVAYAYKYYREEGDRTERVLQHHEIRVKERDGKTDKRIGYIKKFINQEIGNPKDEGYTFWRIYNDRREIIGMIEVSGRFYRYTADCEYEYIGTWEMNQGLKNFFGFEAHTNIYFAPVNVYRDN
jgi:hypothetical protein